MKKYIDESIDCDNKQWECYLCTKEDDWEFF